MGQTRINRTFLIFILGILAAIGPFTIDMYLPGFQSIAEDLNATEREVTFTLTSYFIGIAIGQLIYGPIVDKYGRKKPLLVGLSVYILAAIGCSLSTSVNVMIGMRFLQAIGGCAGIVASTAIITDVYPPNFRARAFSSIALVMGVAPLIAPSIGSYFVIHGDWQYIFYFLASFAIIVFFVIYYFLPETSKYVHDEPLKLRQVAKGYVDILKNKSFLYYTLAGSISMSILFAYISSASFVFLTYYGLDKATFSLLFAINASGMISGSYLNGVFARKYNYLKVANVAVYILIVLTGAILLAVIINPHLSYIWIVVAVFSTLFTVGIINPNATAASLLDFKRNSGTASALSGALRMTGGALAAALIGFFQGESTTGMFLLIFLLALMVLIFLKMADRIRRHREVIISNALFT
jgi:DHA1 family bicyclomycin/chloramphenicol resistance-like MFS transporter